MTVGTAVIVGVGAGLGLALARTFAKAGHPVALLARDGTMVMLGLSTEARRAT